MDDSSREVSFEAHNLRGFRAGKYVDFFDGMRRRGYGRIAGAPSIYSRNPEQTYDVATILGEIIQLRATQLTSKTLLPQKMATCLVCFAPLTDLDVCVLDCNHVLHERCLMAMGQLRCPTCAVAVFVLNGQPQYKKLSFGPNDNDGWIYCKACDVPIHSDMNLYAWPMRSPMRSRHTQIQVLCPFCASEDLAFWYNQRLYLYTNNT